MTGPVDIVVRCRNEMPWTERTVTGLLDQEGVEARLFFIDSASTDGSREVAVGRGLRIHDWDPSQYVPGRVLNFGMEQTDSPIVAFINADAVPQGRDSLRALIEPLESPDVAATFARQVARPAAGRLTRVDYERAFGDAPPRTRVGSFFSMAASAIRRDVWERTPFDPDLQYSEDVDWTTRVTALGHRVVYVPEARFEHSHDYDVRGQFKRRRGEGVADSAIHRLGKASIIDDLARPFAGAVLRDARAGVLAPDALALRVVQAAGYFVGRWETKR